MRKSTGRFDPRTWDWKKIWKFVSIWLEFSLLLLSFGLIVIGYGFLGLAIFAAILWNSHRKDKPARDLDRKLRHLSSEVSGAVLVQLAAERSTIGEENGDKRLILHLAEKLIDIAERNSMLHGQYNQLASQIHGIRHETDALVSPNRGRSSIVAE